MTMTSDEVEAWRQRQEAKSAKRRYFADLEAKAAESLLRAPRTPKPKAEPKERAPRKRAPRILADHVQERPGRAQQFTHCATCKRPMRPKRAKAEAWPGTVRQYRGPYCWVCYNIDGHQPRIDAMPANCVVCERPLRRAGVPASERPGTVCHAGRGYCGRCRSHANRHP